MDYEELFDNLISISTDEPDWIENLIKNAEIQYYPRSQSPLLNILKIQKEANGCRSIIIEKEYVDEYYLDEFSYFYSRSFMSYSDKCIRLHFFKSVVDISEISNLSEKQEDYLGFSVVRPILTFNTGRTVIKPPLSHKDNHYILCKNEHEVNLSGNYLSALGTTFIQQDTNVNVCAQAAIWMTSQYMHKKYGYTKFSPSQITELATKDFTLGAIREGLNHYQILSVLKEMGYNHMIHFKKKVPDELEIPEAEALELKNSYTLEMARLIYGYVESEIPVILGIEVNGFGHAITVIGHDFHYTGNPDHPSVIDSGSNVGWIQNFYIHDDSKGPYEKLPIFSGHSESSYSIEENINYAIVPVPKEVTLNLDDVFNHVTTLIEDEEINVLIKYLIDKKGISSEHLFTKDELSGLVFRTYLRRQNLFKNKIPDGMSPLYKHVYMGMQMPKYIWVTEISTKDYLSEKEAFKRKIVGEILIDTTAEKNAKWSTYLSIHLHRRLMTRKSNEIFPLTFNYDPDEKPYSHLVRIL